MFTGDDLLTLTLVTTIVFFVRLFTTCLFLNSCVLNKCAGCDKRGRDRRKERATYLVLVSRINVPEYRLAFLVRFACIGRRSLNYPIT